MHVEIALRFVERDRRQLARFGIGEQPVGARGVAQPAVAQTLVTIGGTRGELAEIVERLMVVLKIGRKRKYAVAWMAVQRHVPTAGIPRPFDPGRVELVANRCVILHAQHSGLCCIGPAGFKQIDRR